MKAFHEGPKVRLRAMRPGVLAVIAALWLAAPAQAFREETRNAPWRLAGISSDQRTLRVIYEGSGCLRDDGRAVVDTSSQREVRITVRQTVDVPTGPYEGCIQPLYKYRLAVQLEAPLDGRRVVGGPRFDVSSYGARVPRVIGLRLADAREVLRGLEVRVHGIRRGVVRRQSPRPGTRIATGRPLPAVSLHLKRL